MNHPIVSLCLSLMVSISVVSCIAEPVEEFDSQLAEDSEALCAKPPSPSVVLSIAGLESVVQASPLPIDTTSPFVVEVKDFTGYNLQATAQWADDPLTTSDLCQAASVTAIVYRQDFNGCWQVQAKQAFRGQWITLDPQKPYCQLGRSFPLPQDIEKVRIAGTATLQDDLAGPIMKRVSLGAQQDGIAVEM